MQGVQGPRIEGMAHGLGLKAHGEKPYALRLTPVCQRIFEPWNPGILESLFYRKGWN